ncbi:MAG: GNAT family N-acetyltransferase [Roseicyclus sp.]
MILRTGETGDAGALREVLEGAFRDYLSGIGREGPFSCEWLPARLSAGEIEVAAVNGTPLGMAALSHDASARRLTVDILAVDPEAQGCGLGRCLLTHVETRARRLETRSIHLHTVAAYGGLLGFYAAAGFEVTHHGPRPKGDDGHPRAFLEKRLSEGNIPA